MVDERNKVMLAAAGSVGVHVLLLLLWALSVQWLPCDQPPPADVPEPEPIKVTLEEEKIPVPAPTPPLVHFLDTTDMVEASSPPPDARARSLKNTRATSVLPAQGDDETITQHGRQASAFVLDTRNYLDTSAGPDTPSDATPAPPVETAPPLPRAVARQITPPPPSTAPPLTPAPRKVDFALGEPASLPAQPSPSEPNPYDPSFRSPVSMTEPPRPTPASIGTRRVGYQPSKLQTAVSGSINNQGTGSLASVATPLGRYQNTVIDAIRRRWYGYLGQRTDLASMGQVTIHFLVGMDGRARSTKVVANTANEALASISLQAILDARFAPMPADAVPDTGGGQLPMDLTFEFIDSTGF